MSSSPVTATTVTPSPTRTSTPNSGGSYDSFEGSGIAGWLLMDPTPATGSGIKRYGNEGGSVPSETQATRRGVRCRLLRSDEPVRQLRRDRRARWHAAPLADRDAARR